MLCSSTGADSDASPPTGCFPATDGIRQVILSPPKSSGLPVRTPPNAPASRTNRSILIRYATVLPPIYSKPGPTCGPSRGFLDIATLRKRRFICISPGDISAPRVVRWMHSRFTNKESRHRAYESASFGGGRHRSLCGSVVCRAQLPLDQLAASKGLAGHRSLPHRRVGRASRSVLELRTFHHLLQLVPQPALSKMPGQRAPALAPGTRTGAAAYSLRACRFYPAT